MPPVVRDSAPQDMCPGRLHHLLEAAEAQLGATTDVARLAWAIPRQAGEWDVQEVARSDGRTYKLWLSPSGKMYRTLKEAMRAGFVSA